MNNYPKYPYYGKETKCEEKPITFPPQHQTQQPGLEYIMTLRPIFEDPSYIGSHKLHNKLALISGGDSGIGRAVAIAFAKEDADVVIAFLNEQRDADETKARIEQLGRRCLALQSDLRSKVACTHVIEQTIKTFGKIDILVNNAAVVYPQEKITDISEEQLIQTFTTNVFSYFYLTQSSMPYLKSGSSIIYTTSIAAYSGEKTLIDYSSTKGAIVSFSRSLALSTVGQGIRVNAVAPGPIWTPLIPASFSEKEVSTYGSETPMKRAGQPFELAPTYVYLASQDSQYVTGETLHVNGGSFITS
jgi:NAD(P)-dependent dehydrogenase (short-subunit alcohol dehydrogenase family)